MSEPIINVNNLSKCYRIGLKEQPYKTFREAISEIITAPIKNFSKLRKLTHFNEVEYRSSESGDYFQNSFSPSNSKDVFWALKNISFEVKEGEVIGIIGRNGAGKSTLLKIISRITEPTSGEVLLNGRVSSLLEVGTGFHPELTGRENIFLNGAILGMRKEEITRKFDEIVDFAEIEKFLDTPVKFYSSGMYVRLAFAVAAHLEPEILLVDEVLAVGDSSFQKKCLGKMGDVASKGRTVLFVSHNMGAIQSLCDRVVLLDDGAVVLEGPARTVIGKYLSAGLATSGERVWPEMKNAPGDEVARMRAVRVLDQNGNVCTRFDVRDSVSIEIEYWVLNDTEYLDVSFYFYNERGDLIFISIDDTMDSLSGGRKRPAGFYISQCKIPADLLNNGQVYVMAALTDEKKVHTIKRDVVMFIVGDEMDPRGSRGNYIEEWPAAAVRPRLKWKMEQFALSHMSDQVE